MLASKGIIWNVYADLQTRLGFEPSDLFLSKPYKWPEMLLKAYSYSLDLFFYFYLFSLYTQNWTTKIDTKVISKVFLFFLKIVTFHGRSSTYDLIQTVEWKQYFQCTVVRLLREKSDKIFPIDRNEWNFRIFLEILSEW